MGNADRLSHAEQIEAARLMIEEIETQRDQARDRLDAVCAAADHVLSHCTKTIRPGSIVHIPAEAVLLLHEAVHGPARAELVRRARRYYTPKITIEDLTERCPKCRETNVERIGVSLSSITFRCRSCHHVWRHENLS